MFRGATCETGATCDPGVTPGASMRCLHWPFIGAIAYVADVYGAGLR